MVTYEMDAESWPPVISRGLQHEQDRARAARERELGRGRLAHINRANKAEAERDQALAELKRIRQEYRRAIHHIMGKQIAEEIEQAIKGEGDNGE
jgi:hypothetical protein